MSVITQCERCREYNAAAVDFRNQVSKVHAALLALVDAVAWERECWSCPLKNRSNAEKNGFSELWASRRHARAEVDRLIANEGAANCKGEG